MTLLGRPNDRRVREGCYLLWPRRTVGPARPGVAAASRQIGVPSMPT
ncbi:hypothetical protein ACFPM0_05535 [Pseudonocardia sulfidoxydans]